MNKYWSLFLLVGMLCGPIARAAEDGTVSQNATIDGKEITLARHAKAFIGEGNVRLEIAPYKVGDQDGAILVFHGLESDWDGKAINHRVLVGGFGGTDYVATYQGKDWHTLVMRKQEEGADRVELYVPGVPDGIALAPSDGAAQLTTPRAIYQEYQDQHASAQSPGK